MSNPIGIELLTGFDSNPLTLVTAASDLGCSHISLAAGQFPVPVFNTPAWSLRDDAELQQSLKKLLKASGVGIGLGEGFAIREGQEIQALDADLSLMAEFGAHCVNTVLMDTNLERCYEQITWFAERARELGMQATLEFAPGLAVATLNHALDVLAKVGHSNLALLIDSMHLFRSGGTVEQLENLEPEKIGYAQVSDCQMTNTLENYMQEATFNRLPPGEGELPLKAFVQALPQDFPVSLEVPNKDRASVSGFKSWMEVCIESFQSAVK